MSARHNSVENLLGRSPTKVAKCELGSERRETVRSLSIVGMKFARLPTLVQRTVLDRTAGLPVVPPGRRVSKSGSDGAESI